MKKYLILLLILLSIIVPSTSSAQDGLMSAPNFPNCASFSRDLRYQFRDTNSNGEISTLQNFLRLKNYLNANPTGYFGPLTVKAIKNFQSANGISPTGYVGPITRAKIKAMTCGEQIAPPSTTTSTVFPTNTAIPKKTAPKPIPSQTSSQSFPSGCHSNSSNEWSSTTGMACGNSPSTSSLAPAGCNSTSNFSSITGLACTNNPTPAPTTCSDSGYDSTTGFLCGCSSTSGYSSVNGKVCAMGSTSHQSLPDGCFSSAGFSSTTGQSCSVNKN